MLNLETVRQDRPAITSTCTPSHFRLSALEGPNDLQISMAAAMIHKLAGQKVADPLLRKILSTLRTREDTARFLMEENPPHR